MFLTAFASSIFLYTWLDGLLSISLVRSLTVSAFSIAVCCLIWRGRYTKLLTEVSVGILLAGGALVGYGWLQGQIDEAPRRLSGQIVDIWKPETYILRTDQGTWLLKTEQELVPGALIEADGWSQLAVGGIGKQEEIVSVLEFDYPKWLYMKGYLGQFTATSLVVQKESSPGWLYQGKDWLRTLLKNLNVPQQTKGLLLGILIGDRSLLPSDAYDGFIRSGLVHIIAVSGSNLVYVLLFGNLVLFFVPYYTRSILLCGALIVYTLLCGMDSSIVRALVIGLLTVMLIIQGRYTSSYRLIAMAFVGMLLWNPYFLVYDLGFLLSFAALIGVMQISTLVRTSLVDLPPWLGKILLAYVYPTVGATLGVLPVILLFGDGYNLLGMIANILVVPVLPALYVTTVGSLLIGGSRLGELFVWGSGMIGAYIFLLSDRANHRGISIGVGSVLGKIGMTGVLVGSYYWVIRLKTQKKDSRNKKRVSSGVNEVSVRIS